MTDRRQRWITSRITHVYWITLLFNGVITLENYNVQWITLIGNRLDRCGEWWVYLKWAVLTVILVFLPMTTVCGTLELFTGRCNFRGLLHRWIIGLFNRRV
jgi:hypothetical protein